MSNNQYPMPALPDDIRQAVIAWNLMERSRLEMMGDTSSSRYISTCITLAAVSANPYSITFDSLRDTVAEVTGGVKHEWGPSHPGLEIVPPMIFTSLLKVVRHYASVPQTPELKLPESVDVHHAPPAYSNAGANAWVQGANWMLAKAKRLNPTSVSEPALKPEDHAFIREIFMRTGFTISESQAELTPYVYYAATHLLHSAGYEVKRLEGGDYAAS